MRILHPKSSHHLTLIAMRMLVQAIFEKYLIIKFKKSLTKITQFRRYVIHIKLEHLFV